MTPGQRLDAEAGEFVLGLLSPEEQRAAEARLPRDAAFSTAVARWRERFSELDAVADRGEPSPDLWRRIEAQIDRPQVVVRAGGGGLMARLWSSLGFWRAAGLAGSLAALALAVGLAALLSGSDRRPVVVAVLENAEQRPAAVVEAFADGSILLRPLADIEVPAGRSLQVWTLWDRQRGPVSLGLLEEVRAKQFAGTAQPMPRPEQLYEVSLEPANGSPTGRPTGPILLKGAAAVPR